jgi:hypothetical protein
MSSESFSAADTTAGEAEEDIRDPRTEKSSPTQQEIPLGDTSVLFWDGRGPSESTIERTGN